MLAASDYVVGIDRLKRNYGNNFYSDIQHELLWDYVKRKNIFPNQWIEICNSVICSKGRIPTIKEFREVIDEAINHDKSIYEPRFKVEDVKKEILCNWCKGIGHVWVSKKGLSGKVFAFCDCEKGHWKKNLPINKYHNMVMWSDTMVDFFRTPVDHDFFTPKSGELIVEDFINKKVDEYKKMLNGSDQYWAKIKENL